MLSAKTTTVTEYSIAKASVSFFPPCQLPHECSSDNAAFRAIQAGLLQKPEELQRDIQTFFSLPIPKAVWSRMKEFQDAAFVQFVEDFRRR